MGQARAIVFDLYETLVTEFDPAYRSGAMPAERLGVAGEIFDRLWRARKADRMTRVVDFRDVLRAACDAADIVVDESVEGVIEALHLERLTAKAKPLLNVDARVVEMLERLKGMGLQLGLVSNCSVEEVAAWSRSPLAGLVDETVFSYEVGCAKPEREIYSLACRSLGVPLGQAVFVGDGGSDELYGAARAGMTPYCGRWFLDRWPAWRRRRTDQANRNFPQLADPMDLVEMVNGS